MSSNSSSSEEEYGKIKEAVDEAFLTENLYTNDELKNKTLPPTPKSASTLRNQRHELSINPFSVKVTPEFQSHVAKHLSKLLDASIDDTEIIQKRNKLKIKKKSNSGVKLLSSSRDYLVSTNTLGTIKRRKFAKKSDLNEIDYEKRAKEVAVSSEWVLSQEETRYWSQINKGNIEIVKLDANFGKIIYKNKANGSKTIFPKL